MVSAWGFAWEHAKQLSVSSREGPDGRTIYDVESLS